MCLQSLLFALRTDLTSGEHRLGGSTHSCSVVTHSVFHISWPRVSFLLWCWNRVRHQAQTRPLGAIISEADYVRRNGIPASHVTWMDWKSQKHPMNDHPKARDYRSTQWASKMNQTCFLALTDSILSNQTKASPLCPLLLRIRSLNPYFSLFSQRELWEIEELAHYDIWICSMHRSGNPELLCPEFLDQAPLRVGWCLCWTMTNGRLYFNWILKGLKLGHEKAKLAS